MDTSCQHSTQPKRGLLRGGKGEHRSPLFERSVGGTLYWLRYRIAYISSSRRESAKRSLHREPHWQSLECRRLLWGSLLFLYELRFGVRYLGGEPPIWAPNQRRNSTRPTAIGGWSAGGRCDLHAACDGIFRLARRDGDGGPERRFGASDLSAGRGKSASYHRDHGTQPRAIQRALASRNKQLFRITDRNAWRGTNRSEPLFFPNYEADAAPPKVNRTLLLDLGDWVPYQKGKPVKFNVMDRDQLGVKSLVIQREGGAVEEVPLEGPCLQTRTFDLCGNYTAHVVHSDGAHSQACEFAICDLQLDLPSASVSINEAWRVAFNTENIRPIAIYLWNDGDSYGRHPLFLTDEQRRESSLEIPAGLLKKTGKLQVWLIGEHPLGRLKLRKDITLIR